MWKHEIIDSLRYLQTKSLTDDFTQLVNSCLDDVKVATEFYLGDVYENICDVKKIIKNETLTAKLFSKEDGSCLPYPTTLLSFIARSLDGQNVKAAFLLVQDESDVRAFLFQFDTEFMLWSPPFVFAVVSNGVAKIHSSTQMGQCSEDPEDKDIYDNANATNMCLWIALRYLRIIHAKNIFHQPHNPSAGMNRKRVRRGDTQAEKYYTLAFSAPGEIIEKDNATGEYKGINALHFCRGHLRIVKPEKPLFGRSDCYGVFWIPPHMRGNKKNGEVIKDYRVVTA